VGGRLEVKELVITILTGGRPGLLRRTLDSIERHSAQVLAQAHVVTFVNGGDAPSLAMVRAKKWIDDVRVGQEGTILKIGPAVSALWKWAPLKDAKYLLHLEDDWECSGEWMDPARTILEKDPQIGQVRLRRHVPKSAVGHAVMRYHMVTGRPLQWDSRHIGDVKYAVSRAHFTLNPALIRVPIAEGLLPCGSEVDAAIKFHSTGRIIAQWIPGAFGHIGGEHSLREKVGKK
jgi:hypothetical protein